VQELNFSLADLFEHKNQMFWPQQVAIAAATAPIAQNGSNLRVIASGRSWGALLKLYQF
jgi:hypothetical protein